MPKLFKRSPMVKAKVSLIGMVEREQKKKMGKGRRYINFPDGLRIIVEDGKYVGFYTQKPCDK